MFLKSSVSLKQEIECSRIIDFIRILYTVVLTNKSYFSVIEKLCEKYKDNEEDE